MFLTEAANRGSVSTGYNINNSLKFEADNTEYLKWTDFSDNASDARKKKFSFSLWCKRTELGVQQLIWNSGANGYLSFEAGDVIKWQQQYGGVAKTLNTNRLFRDTASWYHIIVAVDSTQSTEANRVRLYINGVEETSFSSATYPSQNATADNVYGDYLSLGRSVAWGAGFNGYVADYLFVSEVQLVPTDVGEFDEDTGIWKPKAYSGTISTPSHFLEFQDGSDLGTATSGLDADTMNNIAAADQATDTPTNNFAIANTLTGQGGFFVITEGATKGVLSTAGPGNNVGGVSLVSTLAPSSGKWYFEAQNTNSGDAYLFIGAADTGSIAYTDGYVFGGQNGTLPSIAWRGGGAYDGSAKVYSNNSATGSSVNWETEVVGVALDLDNNKIYFHKSGTWINSGDPANGTDNGGQYDLPTAKDGQWYLGVSAYNLATWLLNFGGYTTMSISSAATDANGYGTFEYAPPSGYYALCTKNLAEYG